MKSLPKSKQIAYAMGQFGWSILVGIVTSYLLFYYVPTSESGIPHFIPQIAFFGFITIIMLIFVLDRLIGAITDPWIASLSDRSTSKHGRRISFMRLSAIPFTITTILVFINPGPSESWINAIFLTLSLLSFYFFYAMYVTPFTALMTEITHTDEERINISTLMSVSWFLGFVVATLAPALWGVLEGMGMDKMMAIRVAVIILSAIAFVFLMMPILFIDEHDYSTPKPSTEKKMESLKIAMKNPYFRPYVVADFVFWISQFLFQMALIQYISVLLGLSAATLALFTMILGLASFALYVPINLLAKKFGKKAMLTFGFVMFIITYTFGATLGLLPIPAMIQGIILVLLAAIPMAIFGILPNVVISDIAEYDSLTSGTNREAIFFGTRTFVSKLGNVVAMGLLSGFLLIQYNGSSEFGVRLTAIAAIISCAIGFIIFVFKYNEKELNNALKIAKEAHHE
ncbi:MAG: MFS transporter [Culicoidibacterales bacterium]